MVAYDTPLELLETLRRKLDEYINQEKNRREWSNVNVNIDKMEFQNVIHIKVGMEHRPNWQDWGGRWQRRTAFMRFLKTTLEELDLRYTKPVQPVLVPGPPPGWNAPSGLSSGGGGSGVPRSPSLYLGSPMGPGMGMGMGGLRGNRSRDTLDVPVLGGGNASRDTLGRVGSFRSGGGGIARATSKPNMRPAVDRYGSSPSQ
jgi:hypothetical protein